VNSVDAIAGLVLSQINYYRANGRLYDFQVISTSLGRGLNQQIGTYDAYRQACQGTADFEGDLFKSGDFLTAYDIVRAMCVDDPLGNFDFASFG
jgi:hypothetical protein